MGKSAFHPQLLCIVSFRLCSVVVYIKIHRLKKHRIHFKSRFSFPFGVDFLVSLWIKYRVLCSLLLSFHKHSLFNSIHMNHTLQLISLAHTSENVCVFATKSILFQVLNFGDWCKLCRFSMEFNSIRNQNLQFHSGTIFIQKESPLFHCCSNSYDC